MLAAVASAIRCAAWARKGPATAPARVAAAWLVRNTALTRPRAALARLAEALGMRLIITARLVTALATLAHLTGQDLTEPDWWRILDALVLVAAHPAAS